MQLDAFIRPAVCAISASPPEYFDCALVPTTSPAPSAIPTLSPSTSLPTTTASPSRTMVEITVVFLTGPLPGGVSWRIETLRDEQVLFEVPTGGIEAEDSLVTTTIGVPDGELLNLVVTDDFGAGFSFDVDDGIVGYVILGSEVDSDAVLARVSNFFRTLTTTFLVSPVGVVIVVAVNTLPPPSGDAERHRCVCRCPVRLCPRRNVLRVRLRDKRIADC